MKQNFRKVKRNYWRYHHLTNVQQKSQSYDVYFLGYEVWQTWFFAILVHFLPYWPQKWKFGKNVKTKPGDIILLHMCSINEDHMRHGFSDIRLDRPVFFVILGHFLPLTLLTTQKIKILKNWKKNVGRHYFTHVYRKWKSYNV